MNKKQKKMLLRIIIAAVMLAALYFLPVTGIIYSATSIAAVMSMRMSIFFCFFVIAFLLSCIRTAVPPTDGAAGYFAPPGAGTCLRRG